MFFLGVPFFSFLFFFNSKYINCSKSFVLKCKIQSVRDRVFRSLGYVDAILILLTRNTVRFQMWISAKSLNTARYNRLTFHLNSKAFERNWESWYCSLETLRRSFCPTFRKNSPVFLWEFMDQVRTYRFWSIGQGRTRWMISQHRPNKVLIIITI